MPTRHKIATERAIVRLLGVQIQGYRRLVRTEARLDDDLVAIVGPNEAGKSSLLSALSWVESGDELSLNQRSRASAPVAGEPIVRVWYGVDRDDLVTLPVVNSDRAVLIRDKFLDGRVEHSIRGSYPRDLAPRSRGVQDLRRLAVALNRSNQDDLATELQAVASQLDTIAEDLDPAEIERAHSVLERGFSDLSSRPAAVTRVRDWLSKESEPAPHLKLLSALEARRPTFTLFTLEERELLSAYDVTQPVSQLAPSLRNVADLAELELEALQRAIGSRDHVAIADLTNRASRRLDSLFERYWDQEPVETNLYVDSAWLHIQVRDKGGHLHNIVDRSDGLRSFLALLAFVNARSRRTGSLILLVDEADAHLHFDAQADLIQLFESQSLARSVVYTTHSPACLPSDLGRSIRAVRKVSEDASEIVTSIWQGTAGLSPLLWALGASNAAFTPARRAVVAEGPSDAILLPTLIREATGLPAIEYQVAPGLSSLAPTDIPRLETEVARVGYLVDGDDAGTAIIDNKLRPAGIPKRRIVSLSLIAKNIAPEDLVLPDLYADAVNQELAPWAGRHVLNAVALPAIGRANFVEEWCADRKISAPYKPSVASRLIERTHPPLGQEPRSLLDPAYKPGLTKVHRALVRATAVRP